MSRQSHVVCQACRGMICHRSMKKLGEGTLYSGALSFGLSDTQVCVHWKSQTAESFQSQSYPWERGAGPGTAGEDEMGPNSSLHWTEPRCPRVPCRRGKQKPDGVLGLFFGTTGKRRLQKEKKHHPKCFVAWAHPDPTPQPTWVPSFPWVLTTGLCTLICSLSL